MTAELPSFDQAAIDAYNATIPYVRPGAYRQYVSNPEAMRELGGGNCFAFTAEVAATMAQHPEADPVAVVLSRPLVHAAQPRRLHAHAVAFRSDSVDGVIIDTLNASVVPLDRTYADVDPSFLRDDQHYIYRWQVRSEQNWPEQHAQVVPIEAGREAFMWPDDSVCQQTLMPYNAGMEVLQAVARLETVKDSPHDFNRQRAAYPNLPRLPR